LAKAFIVRLYFIQLKLYAIENLKLKENQKNFATLRLCEIKKKQLYLLLFFTFKTY